MIDTATPFSQREDKELSTKRITMCLRSVNVQWKFINHNVDILVRKAFQKRFRRLQFFCFHSYFVLDNTDSRKNSQPCLIDKVLVTAQLSAVFGNQIIGLPTPRLAGSATFALGNCKLCRSSNVQIWEMKNV